jgi:hypothetical protein
LLDPHLRRIEVAQPVDGAIRGWTAYGPGDVVSSPFGDIDVDALYDVIDRTAATT